MNGVVHDVVWVKSIAKMGGDAGHWDATPLWVLTEALVVAIREGKEKQHGRQEHLYCYEEVLVGSCMFCTLDDTYPVEDGK